MRKSVRELKDQLSQCVRRVARGEEIIVTSHNRPVAKLVPLTTRQKESLMSRSELLDELADLRERLERELQGEPLSQVVVEMRREERY
jgi:prevent-host-death family protein